MVSTFSTHIFGWKFWTPFKMFCLFWLFCSQWSQNCLAKSVYDRFFTICSIKSPQCTDKNSKKYFDSNFPSLCFDEPKGSNFTSGSVQNCKTTNRRLNDCDVISGLEVLGKQISPTFSYKQFTFVPFFGKFISSQSENNWESFKSWNDITIIPSLLFLVSRFCTPPKMRFDAFGSSKHMEGKLLLKHFFAILISALWGFYRANKKNLSYTL